ncbi:hypothetical protein BC629DRAFT_1593778 [Irpex lacteus]|nr:hypothetical protein BC629DRAFT_1593778 [Irpex lacteus]
MATNAGAPLYPDPPIAYDIDERPAQRGAHGCRADWAECQTTSVTANEQLAFSPQRTLLVGIMASLRLAWGASKPTTPLRVSQTSVRWMAAGGDPRVAKDAATMADPRVDIIRRTLYPANVRSRESPTGTWRSNVGRRLQRAIPSVQAHETIERAWLLHQRHIRRGRQAELERKFKCMKEAMDYLYELDPKLHAEANKVEDPRVRTPQEVQLLKTLKGQEKKAIESRIRGLFPRELRIPTDTPSRDGWRYDWDPPIAPL